MPSPFWLILPALVFLLCTSLLAYQFRTGVPPMPTRCDEANDVVALLEQAGLPEHPIIYELGSGWGSLVVRLARVFPQAQIRGIEWSPLPYWIARLRTRHMPNVQLTRGNFFASDLRDAHAVTCYLMIGPMRPLAALLDAMLQHGTAVVSVTFSFRGRRPDAVRKGKGLRGAVARYSWPAFQDEVLCNSGAE